MSLGVTEITLILIVILLLFGGKRIPELARALGKASYEFKKAKNDFTKDKILPTVALTALVFGLQMINFAIPQTGSSGHIVGGMLLAAILGPYVGFLAICTILLVQALFFADGGLLALGCKIFNMGFLTCFVAYPLIYKPLAQNKKVVFGSILASVATLQLGSFAVVIQAALSGSITNVLSFAGFMQSIHLAIGIVEGIVCAIFVLAAQKTQLSKTFSYIMGTFSILLAGIISNYASAKPDGLEWSLLNMSNSFVEQTQGQIYTISETLQAKSSFLINMPNSLANLIGLCLIIMISAILSNAISKKITPSDLN